MALIFWIIFGILGMAKASIPDLDIDTIVFIEPSSSAFMEISCNPSSGYLWYVLPPNSAKISVRDVYGVYTPPPEQTTGKSGHQTFEILCNYLCSDGDKESLILYKSRTWDMSPSETKNITIIVTTGPHIQNEEP
ncbi:hypothetical protein SteCoe_22043 [Stentor coeruleus]|uniref:Proteinase inhibitor I42 chagasin domain-containing protein n=1 Tax=Stentor coeruleus TaxID=5963 RepID=A0A1R2BN40_9CILI|nr:hypothetical protein SteCoe_22043 [Stentor coeruleus]